MLIYRLVLVAILSTTLLILSACGDDQDSQSADNTTALEGQGGVCFNVEYPWWSGSGTAAGSPITVYLYVDESMVDGATGAFEGDCSVEVDGDDIIVESGVVFAAAAGEAPSPYSVACGDVVLEARTYTVKVGDEEYEFVVPTEQEAGVEALPPEWAECVGVGEELTEEDGGEVCVQVSQPMPATSPGIGTAMVQITTVHEIDGNSCTDAYVLDCDFQVSNNEIEVSTTGTYRSYHHMGDCTADIWPVESHCGTRELDFGDYEINYGGEVFAFQVPAASGNERICGP